MKELAYNENINFNFFDTIDKSKRKIFFEAIFSDMRSKCIDELNREFK